MRSLGAGVSRYFLQPHVHVCVTDDAAIFLDLRCDKYIGLSGAQVQVLQNVLDGLRDAHSDIEPAAPSENDGRVLADKLERVGLLTRDARIGKSVSAPNLERAAEPFVEKYSDETVTIRFRDVISVAATYAYVRLSLRFGSLEKIIDEVRNRKTKFRGTPVSLDSHAARTRVIIFEKVRPFVYRRDDRCLLDSLTLTLFLSKYGLFPSCVIGARPNPFSAHAWVQHGKQSLNGDPAYLRRFTPILVV
jgi:Transglutaminase-like superfamily